jgi:hypothetical protein
MVDKPIQMIYADGQSDYFDINGEYHNHELDEPIIDILQWKSWYKHGQLHRDDDKPALIYPNGGKSWYQNALLHRDGDKPAVIYADGSKYWYQNGLRIRVEIK